MSTIVNDEWFQLKESFHIREHGGGQAEGRDVGLELRSQNV